MGSTILAPLQNSEEKTAKTQVVHAKNGISCQIARRLDIVAIKALCQEDEDDLAILNILLLQIQPEFPL